MFQILSIELSKCFFLKLESELQNLVKKIQRHSEYANECNLNFRKMECIGGAGLNFMGNGKGD